MMNKCSGQQETPPLARGKALKHAGLFLRNSESGHHCPRLVDLDIRRLKVFMTANGTEKTGNDNL